MTVIVVLCSVWDPKQLTGLLTILDGLIEEYYPNGA